MLLRELFHRKTILEAVRPAFLYHGTTVERLYEILEDNEIKANTGHRIDASSAQDRGFRSTDADTRGYVNGVSLSRSERFAAKWCQKREDGVVLVLDGDSLKRRFRIIPVSFWGGRNTRYPESGPSTSDESEEFLIGPIKPVKQYLIEVRVAQAVLDRNHVLKFALGEQDMRLVII